MEALLEPLLSSSLFIEAPRQRGEQQLMAERLLACILLSGVVSFPWINHTEPLPHKQSGVLFRPTAVLPFHVDATFDHTGAMDD